MLDPLYLTNTAANANPSSWVVAVDGGGTATRARLYSTAGEPLAEGRAGPSGLSLGVGRAWAQIQAAVAEACLAAGLGEVAPAALHLSLGLAGASSKDMARDFVAVGPRYREVHVHSDVMAAHCGAFGGGTGVIVIAGTGSVAVCLGPDAAPRRAGGWGFPEGDEGSGGWFGLRAVRHAEQALDGRARAGALARRVWTHVADSVQMPRSSDSSEALRRWRRHADQTAYAALAPIVFEVDVEDGAAAALLDRAARELRDLVVAVDPDLRWPVVVVGSVGRRLVEVRPGAVSGRLALPLDDALSGAFRLWRDARSSQRAP